MKHNVTLKVLALACVLAFTSLSTSLLVGQEVQFAEQTQAETDLADDDSPVHVLNLQLVDSAGEPVADAEVATEVSYHQGAYAEGVAQPSTFRKRRSRGDGTFKMSFPRENVNGWVLHTIAVAVRHPDFAESGMIMIDAKETSYKIVMRTVFRIAVKAVDEAGKPVTDDLHAICSQTRGGAWAVHENGLLVSPKYMSMPTSVRIVRAADGKPTLFSKEISVDPKTENRVLLTDVKLKQGVRWAGKVSQSDTQSKGVISLEAVMGKSGVWKEFAEIDEQGDFEFETLPQDSLALVHAKGSDSVSVETDAKTYEKLMGQAVPEFDDWLWKPQVFKVADKDSKVEIEMQPMEKVTLNVQADRQDSDLSIDVNFAMLSLTGGLLEPKISTKAQLLGATNEQDKFAAGFAVSAHANDEGETTVLLPPNAIVVRMSPVAGLKRVKVEDGKCDLQLEGGMPGGVILIGTSQKSSSRDRN